jgi:hypothetical protein
MGSYSIYIIFPQDLDGQKCRIRVCAGQVASKKKAMELAYDLLYEEGGGVEAVDVIDWQSQEKPSSAGWSAPMVQKPRRSFSKGR